MLPILQRGNSRGGIGIIHLGGNSFYEKDIPNCEQNYDKGKNYFSGHMV